MPVTHKNRVQMSVTGTPGTGTITLNAASSGYQSFASAYGADATVDVLITDGTAWEVARNCAYTHSGTTLSRGTLEASSTGSAISLTSSAVVSVIMTAGVGQMLESAMQAVIPGGRLTLESGVPVSTSDQTAKTTIYYTPYVHDTIPLWNGTRWVPTTFTETSEALGTLTSGLPYDVFGFLSSGALDLEKLAWTNSTTRATAVTLQDGRYCKSGDKTRLYLGTFYTTATTTTEDSIQNRYVWNAYNRVVVPLRKKYGTAGSSWSYTTGTWRAINGDTTTPGRVGVICGMAGLSSVDLMSVGFCSIQMGTSTSAYAMQGIGKNVTNANHSLAHGRFGYNSVQGGDGSLLQVPVGGQLSEMASLGFSYYQHVEYTEIGGGGTGTVTYFNEDTTANRYNCGIFGTYQC